MSSQPFSTDDFYFPVGVTLEAVLYWFYTTLFVAALWVQWGKRRSRGGFSGWLYLVSVILMWLIASAHLGISIQRLLRVFILEVGVDPSMPTYMRIYDMTKWDTFVYFVLTSVMVWIGDVLVIYRTYIVWSKDMRVVALPILIHVTYVVIGTMTIHAFSQPNKISLKTAVAWSMPVFPLVVAQNIITTGLLSYKIYSTHQESMKNGVTDATSGKLSLGSLARMLIETAMLYTLNLLVLIILSVLRHPAQVITSLLLVPTLGIVFVLLSVRVHFFSETTSPTGEAASKSPNIFELRRPASNDDTQLADPPASLTQPTGPAHVTHEQELHDGYSITQRSNVDVSDAEEEDRQSESYPTISLSRRESREWL